MEKHSTLLEEAALHIRGVRDEVLRNGLCSSLAGVFGVGVGQVRRAGGFGGPAQRVSGMPAVRADAVEAIFLANMIRWPWLASVMPPDVEMNIHGGAEVIAMMREAGLDEGAGAEDVLAIFTGTQFLPLVERLMMSDELGEDVIVLAKRIELAWVERVIGAAMKAPSGVDWEMIRNMLVRKHDVLKGIEKCKAA